MYKVLSEKLLKSLKTFSKDIRVGRHAVIWDPQYNDNATARLSNYEHDWLNLQDMSYIVDWH